MSLMLLSIICVFFCSILVSLVFYVRVQIESAKISRGDFGSVPFSIALLVALVWSVFYLLLMI